MNLYRIRQVSTSLYRKYTCGTSSGMDGKTEGPSDGIWSVYYLLKVSIHPFVMQKPVESIFLVSK